MLLFFPHVRPLLTLLQLFSTYALLELQQRLYISGNLDCLEEPRVPSERQSIWSDQEFLKVPGNVASPDADDVLSSSSACVLEAAVRRRYVSAV